KPTHCFMKRQKIPEADFQAMPHVKYFMLPLFSLGFAVLMMIIFGILNPVQARLNTRFVLNFVLIFSACLFMSLSVRLVCKLLDKVYRWENDFWQRLFLQLGAGCTLP